MGSMDDVNSNMDSINGVEIEGMVLDLPSSLECRADE
jgi:hypothetical protein